MMWYSNMRLPRVALNITWVPHSQWQKEN